MWDRQSDSADPNQSAWSVATTYSNSTNQQQSMLSPRNVMKFISKNIEEMGSPRLGMFFADRNSAGKLMYSAMSNVQVHKNFGAYLGQIETEINKYKAHPAKKVFIENSSESEDESEGVNEKIKKQQKCIKKEKNKEKDKEQIEAQVLLSKIPNQYFQDWDHQQQKSNQQLLNDQTLTNSQKQHKSHKLQALLMYQQNIGQMKKKRKPSLRQKQEDIEQYLDSIQFLIFRKTRKYPDKYLYYLMNFKAAEEQVKQVLTNLSSCRQTMGQKLIKVHRKHEKIVKQIRKKQKMSEMINILKIVKSVYDYKKQSTAQIAISHNTNEQISSPTQNLFQKIQTLKKQQQNIKLSDITSIQQILKNVEILHQQSKQKKLTQFCKQLKNFITNQLSSIYSRDQWLKGQLPKDALMLNQIGIPHEADDGVMNNSYMNISILDQSYCMTTKTSVSQKAMKINKSEKVQKDLIGFWGQYLKEHRCENLQEEEEQISQIIMRGFLKFHIGFQKDLQEYICYIYTQNSLPVQTPTYTNHKERLRFIQPKFYNKIVKVYFSGLALLFSFSLKLQKLVNTKIKVLKQLQEKISQVISMRMIDYNTQYEDVSILVSVLDFWSEQIAIFQNAISNDDIGDEDGQFSQQALVLQLQEHIHKCRNKMIQEYLNSLHQHAVVFQLKLAIQRSSFSPVSVPLSSFSILDFILNWGQQRQGKEMQVNGEQGIDQSMDASFSMLKQLQNDNMQHKKYIPSFSIFKIIDKLLIIEGTQYKICDSFIPFAHYLGAYLHSKFQNPQLQQKIDQKICQLIGFYIWFNKKILFGVSTIGGQKKTIRNLCMTTNICNLLLKIMDILAIKNNQKKVDKVLNDLVMIKGQIDKEIGMVPFYLVEQQISTLYQSRLKTRKQIPTKETKKIVQILEVSRKALQEYYPDYRHQQAQVKIYLTNCVKMITKNYFGYLFNMENRGKAELKWFLPGFKQALGDLFPVELQNMQKNIRF